MKRVITLITDYSSIIMEQAREGSKVKITVRSQLPWQRRETKETIWADKDDANKFYTKRIADGYSRV